MKKLLAALMAMLMLSAPAFAYEDEGVYDVSTRFTGEYSVGHISHIAIGTALSGSIWYMYPDDWNQDWKIPVSVGAVFLTGAIMELTDDVPDVRDVFEYVVPAALTVTVLEVSF